MVVSVSTLVLMIALTVAGVAGGATLYRYGPYASLERSMQDTRTDLNRTKAQLAKEREDHNATKDELKVALKRLGISQRQLKSERGRRNEAETSAERARQDLLLKERDVYVLRTCLTGIGASYYYYLRNDADTALGHPQDVQRECQAARRLVD